MLPDPAPLPGAVVPELGALDPETQRLLLLLCPEHPISGRRSWSGCPGHQTSPEVPRLRGPFDRAPDLRDDQSPSLDPDGPQSHH